MKAIKWIFAASLLACPFGFARPAASIENSTLVAKLPPGWKTVTRSQTKAIQLTEYIPRHEKAGQHSKIIAQAVVRKPKNQQKAFALYHQYKIVGFNRRGCQIKPMITEAFRKQKQHYEVFTYECSRANSSGVDLIYDANKTSIYDLMYEFSSRELSQKQISEAINILKDFKICYENDPKCLNS